MISYLAFTFDTPMSFVHSYTYVTFLKMCATASTQKKFWCVKFRHLKIKLRNFEDTSGTSRRFPIQHVLWLLATPILKELGQDCFTVITDLKSGCGPWNGPMSYFIFTFQDEYRAKVPILGFQLLCILYAPIV